MADEPLNQTDHFVVEMMALLVSMTVVADPKRQAGINDALLNMKQHFVGHQLNKAAALTEHVRLKAADNRSDPTLLGMMRDRPPGSGIPN